MAVCLLSVLVWWFGLPASAQHFSFNKITQNADKEFASLLNSISEDNRGYCG